MRRTTPVGLFETVEPAPPLSHVIKERHAPYIFAAKPPPSFLIRAKLSSTIKGQHVPEANPEP